ncbi:winged helix-turn-helix domain-containing protein [Pleionea sp. CnH1-48]|uniref:winged helix-turn-helix domain-containing protein n=1 Tax=Pleionea sp. CnH1-48 TaxID=2954494 RepID=UPI002097CD11|nr:winged helix-turn-helix domain-containing protein [Pleionea sp. CnH1-48]MCO7224895.1 winged helix-turn-helix domain-containing protein [Pleionea sp. CnH1-48]
MELPQTTQSHLIQFKHWQLDTEKGLLQNQQTQESSKLPHKTTQVLITLIAHHGKTVSKNTLIEKVWNGNTLVGEQGVSNALWRIRKALNEDPKHPIYLETIPKQGYKWLCPLQTDPTPSLSSCAILSISLLLILFLGLLYWQLDDDTVTLKKTLQTYTLHNQSNNYGTERYPAISPDQKSMLFSWGEQNAPTKIFLKRLVDDSAPIQLTNGSSQDIRASWSPDGKSFAFIRQLQGLCHVVEYNLTTHKEKELTQCTMPNAISASLSWSPDGQYIAYTLQDSHQKKRRIRLMLLSLTRLTSQVIPFDADTTSDVFPIWSADSSTLYFLRYKTDSSFALYQFHHDTHKVNSVSPSLANTLKTVFGFIPQNDSDFYLLATLEDSSNASLFHYQRNNHTLSKLKVSGHHLIDLTLADQRLYFVKRYHDTHLGQLNLSSSKPHITPFIQTFGTDIHSTYCQTSGQVAFVSNTSGRLNLWLSDQTGEHFQQLTDYPPQNYVAYAACSPDGQNIAFDGIIPNAQSEGQRGIYLYNIQTQQTRLLSAITRPMAPSWSLDSQNLFFSDGQHMHLHDLAHSTNTPITNIKYRYIQAGSKSGEYLGMTAKGEIWRFTLDNPANKQLVVSGIHPDDWGNWQVTDNGLIYLTRTPKQDQLTQISFVDNQNTPLATFPSGLIRKGKSLTYLKQQNKLVITYFVKNVSSIAYIDLDQ